MMRCIASLAPIQTNPRRTSFRTIYLIRFYAPFPQYQHDGGDRLFSSLARLNFSRGDAFHSPTATRFVCAARGPSSVILFLRTMFAVRPFQSRVVSPRKWRYQFLWAQTQTTPPPSKAFASSVMFVEEESVAFDVVVAAKSLSRFFGSGRGNILATLGPRQLATRA